MQLFNVACPSLELVVPITNEKHMTIEELKVRIWSQLGFKLLIDWGSVRAPVTCILILYRPLLLLFIADGNIEHTCTIPVSMGELGLQPLDVLGKSWTD
jgi:hypothetical protein